eukprot:8116529-Pyramimonas_sp.AAC.1
MILRRAKSPPASPCHPPSPPWRARESGRRRPRGISRLPGQGELRVNSIKARALANCDPWG